MKKLLLTASFLALVSGIFVTKVEAATVPLSGYAWSETIGWIHFKGSNYGVLVDSTTGTMSGFAWSENYGWLSFNSSDLTGCPSGTCTANLNIQSGAVTGWAKFLTSGEWVHLSGSSYGVTYDSHSNAFSGYAWGDTHAGWIKWQSNNPSYGVVTDSPIVAPPEAPSGLTLSNVSKTAITLSWTDNSSGELGFKVERKTGATGSWGLIHTTNPNVETYQNTGLAAGTLYYYRVSATNNGGDSVPTSEVSTTTLPLTSTINVSTTPSASWTINPGNLTGNGGGSKTVTPSGTGTTYSVTPATLSGYDFPPTITNSQGGGSSATLFGDDSVDFDIVYQRSFDYSLSNGGNVAIQKGGFDQFGQGTVTKTISPTSGPAQSVNLSVSGVPSGVSYSVSNQGCSPTCSSTITFTVTPSAAVGTYPLTVTGSPLGKTTQFSLIISNSPDLFVSCSANPSSAQVGQTVVWTATPSQTPSLAPYEYSWTGTNVPAELATYSAENQSFSIIYSTTGQKTVDAYVRDSKGNVAHCIPQGSINIGVSPIFEEF